MPDHSIGTSTPARAGWRSFIIARLQFVTACVALGALAVPFARHHWFLDILSAFTGWLFALGLVAFVGLAALRARGSSVVAGLVFAWLAILVAPFLPWNLVRGEIHADNGHTLRVMLTNVLSRNRETTEVLEMIRAADPDIICAQEIDTHWNEAFAALAETYPHHHAIPRPDNFGIGLWSKYPLLQADTLELGDSTVPTIMAKLDVHGTTLNLLCLHTLPPLLTDYADTRNQQLADVPGLVEQYGPPFLLVGDLNATMWSPYVTDIMEKTGLKNARTGFGIFPTWPADVGRLLVPCPLDQILASPDVHVESFVRGPYVGSDHYPVWSDVVIMPGPETRKAAQ